MSKDIRMVADVSHLAPFDKDGALAEAADRVNQLSRRGLFRGAGALAGGALLFGTVPETAFGQTPKGDVAILNYALTLEYLEAAFYEEANAGGAVTGRTKLFSETAGEHEDTHVTALKKALGSAAIKKPSFDFQGTTEALGTFQQTAILLEDTGVKAYQGAAPDIKTPEILRAAISIHPVEARHAAWIRNIVGEPPAPDAFNPAADMATILAAVKGTNFISTANSASGGSSVSGTPSVTG
ncbi:MAG: ferritin-like domain-containing protein [Solirubrobacterales bacterium]|nr:ferritin-like domain-containing protein [Solirubrobacterales bacterium]